MNAHTPCQVLLVEDDAGDASLLRQSLQQARDTRYQVTLATSLAQARSLLKESPPDVVLMDLSLPDSTGMDTVRAGCQAAGAVPVIVLTGHDDSTFALQTLEAGAQDYLVKGHTDTDTLVRAIRHAIGRSRLEQELLASMQFAQSTLDGLTTQICVLDQAGTMISANEAWRKSEAMNAGRDHVASTDPLAVAKFATGLGEVLAGSRALFEMEYPGNPGEQQRWWLVRVSRVAGSGPVRVVVAHEDISTRRQAEQWQQHYARTLAQITNETDLPEVLEGIAAFAEQELDGAQCSILLLSADGKRLVSGASPSLPQAYTDAINGIAIGDGQGSCGTAAFTGCTVVVEDVTTHPHWTPWRDLAAHAGFRACWSQPMLSSDNRVLGTFSVCHALPGAPSSKEMTHVRQSADLAALAIERARSHEAQRLAKVVFEESLEGIVVTDPDQKILLVNQAFVELTGYQAEEAIGQSLALLDSGRHDLAYHEARQKCLAISDRWQGEYWSQNKLGDVHPLSMSITSVRDNIGAVSHHINIMADISEQKLQAARIEKLAFYDSLTGLPNRALFLDRLEHSMLVAQRHSKCFALMFMDLDRFKEINDSLGHAIGDMALVEVARRFQSACRQDETLARLGGDEFVLIADDADRKTALLIAKRLQHVLSEPLVLLGQPVTLGMSIGIALFPEDGLSSEDLIKHADIAMYRAKTSGGGNRFYQSEMGAQLESRLGLAKRLGQALEAGQLQLYFQPKVNLSTSQATGAEALLRWHDSERGWVSPAEFIPIAEERNMMGLLGEWVMGEACRQMKAWRDAGLGFPGRLAVNLSAQQLSEPEIVDRLLAIVKNAGLSTELFELELTESSMMTDPERAVGIMEELSASGFAIAIDDFGTGYSSLAYIKRFAADHIKIDMSFVRNMLHDRNDFAIVKAITAMARSLGMSTTAEGVEEAAQAEALMELGCEFAQGYHFGRPVPAEEFSKKWLGKGPLGLVRRGAKRAQLVVVPNMRNAG